MKSRPDPVPPSFDRSMHIDPEYQRQFRKWMIRLSDNPELRPDELSPDQYAFIRSQIMLQRGGREAQNHYEQKRVAMTPVLTVPESDDPLGDLHLIFALPEMQDFWRECIPNLEGSAGLRRGPKPAWGAALAVMVVMGMTGISSHLRDAFNVLAGRSASDGLLVMFQSLQRIAEQRAVPSLPGVGAPPAPLSMPSEKTVTRLVPQLAEHVIRAATRARMRLILSLKDYYPDMDHRWLMDATDVPAWTRQVGVKGGTGSEGDLKLRSRCPDAGFRAYKRESGAPGGKSDLGAKDSAGPLVRGKIVKAWRGYYLVALMNQATKLWGPVTLFDATVQETTGIIPLLSSAHRVARELKHEGLTQHDLNMGELVADSAWDTDEWCKLCLVDYGIDPIFRQHNMQGRKLEQGESRDGSIKAITPDGKLVCSEHGAALDHGTLQRPSRSGLQPGKSTDPRAFRVRSGSGSPCGCGRLGLRSQSDWSKMLLHPHHDQGRPDLYAHREAALDTLQEIESGFSSLKIGRKVANGGEERTRLLEIRSVQALVELACLAQVALTVVDQRQRHGERLHLAVPASGSVAPGEGMRSTQQVAA